MIARLRKVEETVANEPLVLETSSGEAPMIAKHADCHVPERHESTARRLRSRLLAANVIVWIAIIALIRLLFF
jgi:hypothetical protein